MAFRFKQFTVDDEQSSLKVGTDAVLLGSWAGNEDAWQVLDIGTGCGLLPLMLAQRFQNARILGIDVHKGSVLDARDNFQSSPWSDRLRTLHLSLREFVKENQASFDLIISNPPFFIESLLPPDENKKIAKHSGELSYKELTEAASLLLKPSGRIALILPYENREIFREMAVNNGLHCSREMIIYPVQGKMPNRYLSEWGFSKKEHRTEELFIRDIHHNYTKDYKLLTRDFYLAH